ncbi:hypothetical protein BU073_01605 [Mammaliicoccus vitulinus]|uniref:Uncharacterized protein n=1 Tax=Mammaliicoccus vitulinus TaxID=71237 RepID=A0A2T4PVR6_9STAP|nr:hypothetical protein BU072_02395 [Mammaliicoccus vitulinus]PTI72912.1 hypothetical protein BU073_01605 [Mammaliicoccus vitulinus]
MQDLANKQHRSSVSCKTDETSNIGALYVLKYYDFESACLPRGMVRACSLSRVLFPGASALCKIVRKDYKDFFATYHLGSFDSSTYNNSL